MLPDLVEPVVVVGLDSLDQLGEGAAVTRLHLRKEILVCDAQKRKFEIESNNGIRKSGINQEDHGIGSDFYNHH